MECAECGKDAVCRCVKCDVFLCDNCFTEMHSGSKTLRTHVREHLDVSRSNSLCGDHAGHCVEYYCCTDDTPICAECAIFGKHKGHKIRTVQQHIEDRLLDVQKLHQWLAIVNKAIAKLHDDEQVSIGLLQQHFTQATTALQLREKELTTKIAEAYSDQVTHLQKLVESMERQIIALNNGATLPHGFEYPQDVIVLTYRCCYNADLLRLVVAYGDVEVADRQTLVPLHRDTAEADLLVATSLSNGCVKQLTSEQFIDTSSSGSRDVSVSPSSDCRPLFTVVSPVSTSSSSTQMTTAKGLSIPPGLYSASSGVQLSVPQGLRSAQPGVQSALPGLQSVPSGLQSALPGVQLSIPQGLQSAPPGVQSALPGLQSVPSCLQSAPPGVQSALPGLQSVLQGAQSSILLGVQSLNTSQPDRTTPDNLSFASCKSSQPSSPGSDVFKEISRGTWEPVLVTSVQHPCHFVVQFQRQSARISQLMRNINKQCEATVNNVQRNSFEKGSVVLAKLKKNNKWYRSQVLRMVNDDRVEVEFLDYGHTEIVSPTDSVKEVPDEFRNIPRLSYICCLDGLTPVDGSLWSPDMCKAFADMLSCRKMIMKVLSVANGTLLVDLAWPKLDHAIVDSQIEHVADCLVTRSLAKYSLQSSAAIVPVKCDYVAANIPSQGQIITVVAITYSSLDNFIVQVKDSARCDELEELMQQIQTVYGDADALQQWTLHVPIVGLPCVAKYPSDNLFYRAKITNVLSDSDGLRVEVVYVDYGNTEVVPVRNVYRLHNVFLAAPVQAVTCSVAEFGTVGELETLYSVQEQCLQSSVENSSRIKLKVVDIRQDGVLIVSVVCSPDIGHISVDKCLPSESSQDSPTRPTGAFNGDTQMSLSAKSQVSGGDPAAMLKMFVSHVVSPSEIYLQSTTPSDRKRLKRLMTTINELQVTRTPMLFVEWAVGMECVACRVQDNRWYRARITQINDDKLKVAMSDFGFTEWLRLEELRPIGAEHMKLSWFACQCHLDGLIPPAGPGAKWPQLTCETLHGLIHEKICSVDIKKVEDPVVGNSQPVDLLLEEVVRGSALSADKLIFRSVSKILIAKELAVAKVPAALGGGGDAPVFGPVFHEHMSPVRMLKSSFLPPPAPSSADLVVVVTHVDEHCTIYVHEMNEEDMAHFQNMVHAVHERYENSQPETDVMWELGSPVAAQFTTDDRYYRAKISSFEHDGIEVVYVDFGNCEVLPKERLRTLDAEFLADPVFCYMCRLHRVTPVTTGGWDSSAIEYITDCTLSKKSHMFVKEIQSDGTLLVDIALPEDCGRLAGMQLSQLLCDRGYAVRTHDTETDTLALSAQDTVPICTVNDVQLDKSPELPAQLMRSPYSQQSLPCVSDCLSVIVTHVDLPNVIYIQHATVKSDDQYVTEACAQLEQLVEMSNVLRNDAASYPLLDDKDFHPGVACIAQFSVDKAYYRGEIVSIQPSVTGAVNSEMAAVRFVDYGSFEFVPRSGLRRIPPEHMQLSPQAIRCCLDGIQLPDDHNKLSDITELMRVLIMGKLVIAVVKKVTYADINFQQTITVDLFDQTEYQQFGGETNLIYHHMISSHLLYHQTSSHSSSLPDDIDVEEADYDYDEETC